MADLGYDADFLDTTLASPQAPDDGAEPDVGDVKLDYMHFTVRMHPTRRLASWVARDNEPVPVPDEQPLLLAQALRKSDGKSFAARLSHSLGVPAPLITHWTQTAGPVGGDPEPVSADVIPLNKRRRA